MSGDKDFSLGGEDREEWDRAWKGRPQRHVASPSSLRIEPGLIKSWGQILDAMIALDPPPFQDMATRENRACVLCGETIGEGDRVPATLYPTFASEISVAIPVWVHASCYEECPDGGSRDTIPW